MNSSRKILTILALVVFIALTLSAQWEMTNSSNVIIYTQCAPIFVPPRATGLHRELASSNFWTWLALGIVYAGLFAVLEKPKGVMQQPDDLKK